MLLHACCLAFGLMQHTLAASLDTLTINTPLGSVKGVADKSLPNQLQFFSFYSIPFAQPPIGSLRFQNPQPIVGGWPNRQVDGTQPPPVCPQFSVNNPLGRQVGPVEGREDCLFLNVHVPNVAIKEGLKLPVLFYIHGGGFVFGSSVSAVPNRLMNTEEVILVTVNYRLGALGFLSMEDDVLPGNLGLKDQTMALQWVKDNIAHFGGDPAKVTIMGNSAGSKSALFHAISPWSNGLFSKVIAQSGSIVSDPALYFAESPLYFASSYVDAVGCDGSLSTLKIRQCLQERPIDELLEHSRTFEKYLLAPNPWQPIVDAFTSKPFIPDQSQTLIESGRFSKVPVILGFTKDEAAYLMPQFLHDEDLLDDLNDVFDVQGPILLMGMDEHSATEEDSATANIYRLHYMGGENATMSEENLPQMQKMFGDIKFGWPVLHMAELLRKHNSEPVYYYRYGHRGEDTFPNLFGHSSAKMDLGVSHVDELFMLFGNKDLNEQDSEMSKKMVSLWTNFVTSGQPDPAWSPLDPTSEDPSYAKLSTNPIKMGFCKDFKKNMKFLEGMERLVDQYRNFNVHDHPAIQAMIQEKSKESLMEEGGDSFDPRDEL